ncbi:hypothetical protein BSKO_09963 [Bryopsis sp. KO-2023]|nr:hypothetical protein BSKO_09963 [Bryopsis sp. KO-2023]
MAQGGRRFRMESLSLWGSITSAVLSSSCCVVQLVLNALSVSCAGFKVLTPHKSLFWAATSLFGWIWFTKTNRSLRGRGAIVLVVACLALSEEFLEHYNKGGLESLRNVSGSPREGSHLEESKHVVAVTFKVPQMGCQGCATKIKHEVMASFPAGSDAMCIADLKSKTVTVQSKDKTLLEGARISAAISRAGYFSHIVKSVKDTREDKISKSEL